MKKLKILIGLACWMIGVVGYGQIKDFKTKFYFVNSLPVSKKLLNDEFRFQYYPLEDCEDETKRVCVSSYEDPRTGVTICRKWENVPTGNKLPRKFHVNAVDNAVLSVIPVGSDDVIFVLPRKKGVVTMPNCDAPNNYQDLSLGSAINEDRITVRFLSYVLNFLYHIGELPLFLLPYCES